MTEATETETTEDQWESILIIEDGSLVDGANSYTDAESLAAYASVRGLQLSGDPETLLISAMDYMEGLDFKGDKYSSAQALQWPRSGVTIDGFKVEAAVIPQQLIKAQIVIAIEIDSGLDPLGQSEKDTKSVTIGVISVDYNTVDADTQNKKIEAVTKPLLRFGSTGLTPSVFKVSR